MSQTNEMCNKKFQKSRSASNMSYIFMQNKDKDYRRKIKNADLSTQLTQTRGALHAFSKKRLACFCA
jgi:hypothetical protein